MTRTVAWLAFGWCMQRRDATQHKYNNNWDLHVACETIQSPSYAMPFSSHELSCILHLFACVYAKYI